MLDEKTIKEIERKLNHAAEIFYHATTDHRKEWSRSYCQGVGFVLDQIGYEIEWEYEKAKIIKKEGD